MESCPGQLCAKNVNNFAAAALHVKSLTLRYFIQLGFFSFFFPFLPLALVELSFILQLQKAAVTTSHIKHVVQRGIFVVLKIIKWQSVVFSNSYFWTCSYTCVFDRVNETRRCMKTSGKCLMRSLVLQSLSILYYKVEHIDFKMLKAECLFYVFEWGFLKKKDSITINKQNFKMPKIFKKIILYVRVLHLPTLWTINMPRCLAQHTCILRVCVYMCLYWRILGISR